MVSWTNIAKQIFPIHIIFLDSAFLSKKNPPTCRRQQINLSLHSESMLEIKEIDMNVCVYLYGIICVVVLVARHISCFTHNWMNLCWGQVFFCALGHRHLRHTLNCFSGAAKGKL